MVYAPGERGSEAVTTTSGTPCCHGTGDTLGDIKVSLLDAKSHPVELISTLNMGTSLSLHSRLIGGDNISSPLSFLVLKKVTLCSFIRYAK